MGFTRRAALALAGLTGLAGCTAPRADTASETEQKNEKAMADGAPRHFNRDDELISPVNNALTHTKESRTEARTITSHVPSDFDTVAAALDEISELRTPPGVRFEILIESGHVFQEAVYIEQQDLRHVRITSEDASVPIDPSQINSPVGGDNDWMFVGWRQTGLPQLECLFDGGGVTNIRGVLYSRGSYGYIGDGAGFESMNLGISASGQSIVTGEVSGTNIIARDMSNRGINIHNSHGNFDSADVSNCGTIGVRLADGADASLLRINASGSDIGIRATGHCRVAARLADLSGGSTGVSITGGSTVDLVNADVSGGSDTVEIEVNSGSFVQAHNCTTSNGTPRIEDTNVSSFNNLSSNGVIFA